MYTLKLKTHFAAAHQLKNAYDQKCNASLHGHNWNIVIEAAVDELANNMVLDFKKIKEVVDQFDHKNLNEILTEEPTAENIAMILWHKIRSLFAVHQIVDLTVEVFEAEGASIKYDGHNN